MDLFGFRSVFSSDPHPEEPSDPDSDAAEETPEEKPSFAPSWGFGGLLKNLASGSDSILQNYRRDLEEFGTGLRRETAALRQAAARAVRELPASLEAGASAAQDSLESVGRVVDDIGGTVWRGTAEIISLAVDTPEIPSDGSPKRYSRFDALVQGLQNDRATFLEAPEDAEEFDAWSKGFRLEERETEIDELCGENPGLEAMIGKLVPEAVEYETFWIRYFYKVHKLRQVEDARAELVKRVISAEEEEELSWEVEDDDYEEGDISKVVKKEGEANASTGNGEEKNEELEEKEATKKEERPAEEFQVGNSSKASTVEEEKVPHETRELDVKAVADEGIENPVSGGDDSVERSPGKVTMEEKVELPETVDSCKDSDFSVVSSQPSMAEVDDLGWDEIEDLGEHDEKRGSTSGGSPDKVDLRKRLAISEDEDLSWDIEDD